MQQAPTPTWIRVVSWVAVGVAPIFVTLGVIHRTPEWALAGAALAVYGLLELGRARRARAKVASPADPV